MAAGVRIWELGVGSKGGCGCAKRGAASRLAGLEIPHGICAPQGNNPWAGAGAPLGFAADTAGGNAWSTKRGCRRQSRHRSLNMSTPGKRVNAISAQGYIDMRRRIG